MEKHGNQAESGKSQFNLEYLNLYYERFGKILSKQDRGKFPRPTVKQTLDYRSFMDRKVIKFLREKATSEKTADEMTPEMRYDFVLGIQHEMEHQELARSTISNTFLSVSTIPLTTTSLFSLIRLRQKYLN